MKAPSAFTTRNNKHRYRKIALKIWGDEKFVRLSPILPSGQGLWLFLLTYPTHDGIPGVYRTGRASMAETLGWAIEDFDTCFKEISDLGMAKADWKSKLVWLPNAARFNPPESPNVVIWWSKVWPEIPECPLKVEIYNALRAHVCEAGDGYCRAFDEHFQKPAGNDGINHSINPDGKASDKTSDKASGKAKDKTTDNPNDKPLSDGFQKDYKASDKGCDNQEQEQEQKNLCGEKGGVGESSPHQDGASPSAPPLQGSSPVLEGKPSGLQAELEGFDWRGPEVIDEVKEAIQEAQTERGTRLPATYVVPQQWLTHAHKTRPDLPEDQLRSAAESFVAHWSSKPGKDGLKLNWLSAWLNWVRKERAPQGAAPRQPVLREPSKFGTPEARKRDLEIARRYGATIPSYEKKHD